MIPVQRGKKGPVWPDRAVEERTRVAFTGQVAPRFTGPRTRPDHPLKQGPNNPAAGRAGGFSAWLSAQREVEAPRSPRRSAIPNVPPSCRKRGSDSRCSTANSSTRASALHPEIFREPAHHSRRLVQRTDARPGAARPFSVWPRHGREGVVAAWGSQSTTCVKGAGRSTPACRTG